MEYNIYNRNSVGYVIRTLNINAAPLFLLLLKTSIPPTTKGMEFEDLAFRCMSNITQTLDRYIGNDIWREIKGGQSFFTCSQINAFGLSEVTEARSKLRVGCGDGRKGRGYGCLANGSERAAAYGR
jgi:hypothetical protein